MKNFFIQTLFFFKQLKYVDILVLNVVFKCHIEHMHWKFIFLTSVHKILFLEITNFVIVFFNKTISISVLLLFFNHFLEFFPTFLWVLINFHSINIFCPNFHLNFFKFPNISIKSNHQYSCNIWYFNTFPCSIGFRGVIKDYKNELVPNFCKPSGTGMVIKAVFLALLDGLILASSLGIRNPLVEGDDALVTFGFFEGSLESFLLAQEYPFFVEGHHFLNSWGW